MRKFKVTEEDVEVLIVTVLEGRGISVGKLSDLVDVPDPYVKLRVANSPNAMQRTKPIANDVNPKWNAEFKFFLDSEAQERKLDLIVMDEDLGFDDTIGIKSYDFSKLKLGEPVYLTFQFDEKAFVDVKLLLEMDVSTQLRYSYDLCGEEKNFLSFRKEKIWKGMKKFLGDEKGPKNIDEVPVVAVMGSGGGFRAMCGFSGVFTALQEAGFLDCATYVSGLSGSSWYISTLYSNSAWPNCSCDDVANEIQNRIKTSFVHLLTPLQLLKYYKQINKKKSLGYPVSFTDFFGCLVGDTLLQNKSFKFSYIKNKVGKGEVPLPLCTAIHVEKDVSAQVFSEWVEFSPYEVGFSKYGVFMKTEYFGGKFYKGRLIRYHAEQPLHYLQGMWGSAFTILFQRLLNENDPSAPNGAKDDGREDLKQFVASDDMKNRNEESDSDDEVETDDEDETDGRENAAGNESPGLLSKIGHILSTPFVWIYRAATGRAKVNPNERKPVKHKTKEKDEQFWGSWINDMINATAFTKTREGRAAEVHNVFRGLKVVPLEADDNSRVVSMSKAKTTFLVDGGLDFNSPYPLLLRPQRNVDIILSFDFSQRDEDNAPPFAELLLAEEWAREQDLPFPRVASDPQVKDPELKELYVFEDSEDFNCPIVMHFVLINKTFKQFKKPGIPRETEAEKAFADFSIFDDKQARYSSFKFDYTHETYECLYQLMKFNTLLNLDVIKEKLVDCIEARRNNPPAF